MRSALLFLCLVACTGSKETNATKPHADTDTVPPTPVRVIAIGDVHGDIGAARSALTLAGVIDSKYQWIGGKTQVVQLGDQLDRGDDEKEILDWFKLLRTQAAEAGGGFHPLLGNHETMNVKLDLRYITDGGFADFADIPYDPEDPLIKAYPEEQRGRVAAFRPGGPYAMLLSEHPMILDLEGSLFVHGGVLPEHLDIGIDLINQQTQAWMRNDGGEPAVLQASDSPVWSRHYSSDTDEADCVLLDQVLTRTGTKRMVVAHTVQSGINAACNDRVWRIDVGLAAYYGGTPQVLEIIGDTTRVIQP